MATREQEFTEVRRLMGFPKQQAPTADDTVAGLIRQEQFMMNLLNGSGRGWSVATPATVTAIGEQADYSLPVSGFGKAMFVYRSLDDNVIVPVTFTDFGSEFHNQTYEGVMFPPSAGESPSYSGEKIAFYRTSEGMPMMRVYPTPDADTDRVYKIAYATGALDWTAFDWPDEPAMPEWSHFKCLTVARFDIKKAEWEGLTPAQNKDKRAEYRADLAEEIAMQAPEFNVYLRNPAHEPTIGSVGAWYED